ncbi:MULTISPECIES: hypothetical protein [Chelativorans]|jgi:hypothetical protein|nr:MULTISPECIES: hypothetical protein [Chelativorans]
MLDPDADPILLNRVDPARKMARHYRVAIEPTSSAGRQWCVTGAASDAPPAGVSISMTRPVKRSRQPTGCCDKLR